MSSDAAVDAPIAERRWSLRGEAGRLSGCTLGAGPPLVLVNGYAARAADWDPGFLAALAAQRTVICPDNRGVGGSELGSAELSAAAMSADLLAVIDQFEIESATVAGWSMGGFVAQELAARAPERVGRLILLATDPGGRDAIPADPRVWARLTDHSGTPRVQASRLIEALFPPSLAPEIDARFGGLVAAARAQLSTATLSAQESAIAAWHAEPAEARLVAIEAPALLACGSGDVVIPPANSKLLAARLPGRSRLESFDGSGHAFMAEVPNRLATLIHEFTDQAV